MKIPRKVDGLTIYGKILVDTSLNKAGDELIIQKNRYGEIVSENQRTGQISQIPNSFMRNPEIFNPIKIENKEELICASQR